MVLLRLFVAWRLLRFFLPLIACAGLLLALSSPLRGPSAGRVAAGARAVTGAVSRIEHAVEPMVDDVRRALTRALLAGRPR
jgi:hypothetical protein